ncbi:MAG: thymidine phosphorylase [Malacoplasma sp.]|nr:thymidine phosphorylase [Malacoplasma sp.]
MHVIDLINKKAAGKELSEKEIRYFITEYTKKQPTITDYQASSLLMAIRLKGMTIQETYYFTKATIDSGVVFDLKSVAGIKIDKHSTGGVGDKVSLILGPICVALGFKVAKLSSIGLGHTGGTIDKLASIGVNTVMTNSQALKDLKKVGMFIMAQTPQICPADKILCSIRNATGTVEALPLICASVLSKKIALKTDYIFIDLKYGSGAFMDTPKKAVECGKLMMKVLKMFNRKGLIHITSMIQPLGRCIGNTIEVRCAMDFLKGKPSNEFVKELIYEFAADILLSTKKCKSKEGAYKRIDDVIKSGKAYKCFCDWAIAQGSSKAILESEIFRPHYKCEVKATNNGYVAYTSAKEIGMISCFLGAGRIKKEDIVDPQAGIYLNRAYNDYVKKGETLATLYSSSPIPKDLVKRFQNNTQYSNKRFPHVKPIYEVID